MTPTEKHREPDGWRYRYEHKPGVWGKWTVQKNKPAWCRPEQPDVQVEPLFSEAALTKAEREGMKRAAEIARGHVYHERYRTWPWWSAGNRSEDSEIVQHSDAIAAAILSEAEGEG